MSLEVPSSSPYRKPCRSNICHLSFSSTYHCRKPCLSDITSLERGGVSSCCHVLKDIQLIGRTIGLKFWVAHFPMLRCVFFMCRTGIFTGLQLVSGEVCIYLHVYSYFVAIQIGLLFMVSTGTSHIHANCWKPHVVFADVWSLMIIPLVKNPRLCCSTFNFTFKNAAKNTVKILHLQIQLKIQLVWQTFFLDSSVGQWVMLGLHSLPNTKRKCFVENCRKRLHWIPYKTFMVYYIYLH